MLSVAELRTAYYSHALPALRIAIDAVLHNRLRAGLTSLGILFGVASVIAMLAIGKGAEQEILAQMKLLGTNNFIVQPVVEQKEEKAKDQGDKEQKRFSPGLTLQDALGIQRVIPQVDAVSGEIVVQTLITREGHRRSGKLVGVDTSYFRLVNLPLAEGKHFTPAEMAGAAPVAIIGHSVKTRFFTTQAPLGRRIKVGEVWLTVVGVLGDRELPKETAEKLGIRDANMDVYVPITTALLRYRNRAQITARDIQSAARQFQSTSDANIDEAVRSERKNYNQLDRIIVRVEDPKNVPAVADVVRRMLTRRHNEVIDFEITVPELLLKQEQRTKTIFNVVLGAIASISLIVGGIGIMNIMLASVMERIREIGVRRAVGARRIDIRSQFLAEATLISLAGGLAGVLIGAIFSVVIEHTAKINTIVSPLSVIVAFGVSLTVGLVFGIVPAWRAAQQDPVKSLRHE